ncbi:MAG TPA: hypothetical protein VGD59_01700 [Acidisarcina sp.]
MAGWARTTTIESSRFPRAGSQAAAPTAERSTRCGRFAASALCAMGLLIAGCGSASRYAPETANRVFFISAPATTLTTSGQVQLRATLASGAAAPVTWSIAEGQNDQLLGQGRIDATGLYTPPAALSRDAVQVLVTARLQSANGSNPLSLGAPAPLASDVLTVTPGFLQPLTPETATLAPGASLEITGKLAEVNGGSVRWSLINNGKEAGAESGAILSQGCERGAANYTTCTALYTAPTVVPGAAAAVMVIGTVSGAAEGAPASAPVSIRLSSEHITSTPLVNQRVQAGPIQLGASGGNNSDYDADPGGNVLECCGGTLGAIVSATDGAQYILSNNHVLAESDQAVAGDTILQPGLIDSGCSPHPARGAGRPVGALRYYVPLSNPQSNVDAALALVNPGAVQADGAILQLGPRGPLKDGESRLEAAPPAGGRGEMVGPSSFTGDGLLEVAKSGRTTGLTCSTIDAIDLSVAVDYFRDCAESQPFYTKVFNGQFGIPGDGFADSGDSGALIVDSRNAEPLGMLFATGTDGRGGGYSVANPIRDVLAELGSQAGQQLSVVGGAQHPVACLNYDRDTSDQDFSAPAVTSLASHLVEERNVLRSLSPQSVEKAKAAAQLADTTLVHRSGGVIGVAVGRSADDPREPAVIVYLDRTASDVSTSGRAPQGPAADTPRPAMIGGVRTQLIRTDARTVAGGLAPLTPRKNIGIHLPEDVLTAAGKVQKDYAKQLMADPAIFGVGVTQSYDDPSAAALLVLVDAHQTPVSTPALVGGLRVRYVFLDRLHVTRSKNAGSKSASSVGSGLPRPASCSAAPSEAQQWSPSRRDALSPESISPETQR